MNMGKPLAIMPSKNGDKGLWATVPTDPMPLMQLQGRRYSVLSNATSSD